MGLATVLLCGTAVRPARAQQSIPPVSVVPRPIAQDVPVYRPAPGDPGRVDAPSFDEPVGALSLRDAVSLALLHSPELAAFAWEVRAREARILQAGRPPNPTATVLAEDLGASGEPQGAALQPVQPQVTIQLSQLIELGGKRTARQDLAILNRDLAAWDYETARIDVLTRVTRAFVDALAAQQALALATETLTIVEQTQQTVGARVTAGSVSPIEQIRADVALASARVESARAARIAEASRSRLATFWGRTARFTTLTGDLDTIPALPSFADLRERLVANPALARWAVEVAQRRAAVAIEQARHVPDVSVSAGYRRFTAIDSNAFLVGATISLPIFDRNQGGIAEAGSRLSKAHEERRAAEMRVSAALVEAYRALASAHAEVTALRSDVLPGSRQAFEAVDEGYRLGRFGYLDVLDAQRTLVTAGGQYLRALTDYHHAVADVEQLTGAPLAGAVPVPTATTPRE
jgi:cobalt-zinc-cadmium efflux system outer membrane protein